MVVLEEAAWRNVINLSERCTRKRVDLSFSSADSSVIWSGEAGKRHYIKFVSLYVDADVEFGFKWTLENVKYPLRLTQGYYIANLVGANMVGPVNDSLEIYAEGACNIKGFIIGQLK